MMVSWLLFVLPAENPFRLSQLYDGGSALSSRHRTVTSPPDHHSQSGSGYISTVMAAPTKSDAFGENLTEYNSVTMNLSSGLAGAVNSYGVLVTLRQ